MIKISWELNGRPIAAADITKTIVRDHFAKVQREKEALVRKHLRTPEFEGVSVSFRQSGNDLNFTISGGTEEARQKAHKILMGGSSTGGRRFIRRPRAQSGDSAQPSGEKQ